MMWGGGGGGNRTRVREEEKIGFYERVLLLGFSLEKLGRRDSLLASPLIAASGGIPLASREQATLRVADVGGARIRVRQQARANVAA